MADQPASAEGAGPEAGNRAVAARGDEVAFELDGRAVVAGEGVSLLDALRDQLGVRAVKDGCSPQGQCGCCTVLVDGAARVACVTPVSRVRGRSVTTVDGLDDRDRWASAFAASGASQCGFCTPGIITRLASLPSASLGDRVKVDRALLAHLCRCTGWQSVHDACEIIRGGAVPPDRPVEPAARRATIEGRAPQTVGAEVALGRGGFADDGAPPDALVAVRASDGSWALGETVAEARAVAGKVQGRRTTAPTVWPVEVPEGDWAITLQTTWVEPAYLEPDAAWCEPGGEPTTPLGNGGAFGGKSNTDVGSSARALADEHARPVRVLWSREDVARFGPKRPPIGLGLRSDGTGVVHAVGPGGAEPTELPAGIGFRWVDAAGPPTSLDLRGAVWAEVLAARAVVLGQPDIVGPDGAVARAEIGDDGTVRVEVECGEVLDEVVLRSYCVGAAHMALGMVRSEALAVDAEGEVHDLTIRSFGVLRATDTPRIDVVLRGSDRPPVNGSDTVFAAVLAAAWRSAGSPPRWPV